MPQEEKTSHTTSEPSLPQDRLVWIEGRYVSDYGDGRKLYVDDDAWNEARKERELELFAENHPGLEEQELLDLFYDSPEEADTCREQAKDELLNPSDWAIHAIECRYDEEGVLIPLNKGEARVHDFSAWVV